MPISLFLSHSLPHLLFNGSTHTKICMNIFVNWNFFYSCARWTHSCLCFSTFYRFTLVYFNYLVCSLCVSLSCYLHACRYSSKFNNFMSFYGDQIFFLVINRTLKLFSIMNWIQLMLFNKVSTSFAVQ